MPEEWTFSKIKTVFPKLNNRIIEEAKEPVTKSSFQAGRPQLDIDIRNAIREFYYDDDNSRACPGQKDRKSVKLPDGSRVHIQKRLLKNTLENLHKKYNEQCEKENKLEYVVSLTTFQKYRPQECVFPSDSSALNICVCMTHENVNFLIKALIKTGAFGQMKELELLKKVIDLCMCESDEQICYLRECEDCSTEPMAEYVLQHLQQKNVQMLEFSVWITSPTTDIVSYQESSSDFVDRLRALISKYIVHDYKCKQQSSYIKELKKTLQPNTEILCQLDFAQNFTCKVQNSIQSFYWNEPQVTIHPFVVHYREKPNEKLKTMNIIVVSEVKSHDSTCVHGFIEKLQEKLKTKLPNLQKVTYLSDGSGEQYKNKYNIKNLLMHEADFEIEGAWVFFVTSHGKSLCDSSGGTIKSMAKDFNVRNKDGNPIKDARSFFDWATSQQTRSQLKADWEFLYYSEEDYAKTKEKLETTERYKDLQTIPGTQSYHFFTPIDENHVKAKLHAKMTDNEAKILYMHKKSMKKQEQKMTQKEQGEPKLTMVLRERQKNFTYGEVSSDSDSDD